MDHFCIIAGTNRIGSTTLKIAQLYRRLFEERGLDATLLSLEHWNFLERTPEFAELEAKWLIPANKFIFISPEYNGSIPGVLKVMLDISDHRRVWSGKKALLTGVSSGRAGNLRGMDHLTGILHYLQVVVHPNKLPLSSIDHFLDDTGNITDPVTLKAIQNQIDQFIRF